MIIPDKKIVFIHIPKTGGTSVAMSLLKKNNIIEKESEYYSSLNIKIKEKFGLTKNLKHGNARKYKEIYGDDFYRFAVIRNPYDRVFSSNRFNQINIDKNLSRYRNKPRVIQKTMKSYLTDKNNNLIVDDVFYYKQIDKVFKHFELEPLHMKKTGKIEKSNFFDTDLKNDIEKMYKEDFEFFGFDYEFNSSPKNHITWL